MVMHKTELKNFAISARRELIEKVALRAKLFGIDEKNGLKIEEKFGQLIVNGETYPLYWRLAFQSLARQLEIKGYQQLIEEVAYTWFNRIIAIRYMELHGYLPERVNVLSSSTGKVEPDILTEFESMDLDVDKDQIKRLIREGDTEQAYRKLFIAQCNALHHILDFLFEKINDYTELLLPDYLLDSESIISKLVKNDALTESFQEVEVIGWLYQYYNTEPKEKVFVNLKKNKKIEKYDIPAATQLFTPKWIVQYMVENSLGQLWLEANPNSPLKEKMRYYIEPAEQEEDVKKKLEDIRYKSVNLEEITIIDPCCGSGHILVYAFELLYQMYEEAGYPSGDIPQLILEKNLYGLDIDDRAAQLSSFALMMKAREKSRRIFRRKVTMNIFSICEANHLDKTGIAQVLGRNDKEKEEICSIIDTYNDAKNYGSLISPKNIDYDRYLSLINEVTQKEVSLENYYLFEQLDDFSHLILISKMLSDEYDIAITNPPYMGSRKAMNAKVKKFVEKNYPRSKSDLYACFIERCLTLINNKGLSSLVTQHSFMFTDDYKRLREYLLDNINFLTMCHLGTGAFPEINGEVVQTTSFVMRKVYIKEFVGKFIRLVDYDEEKKSLNIHNPKNQYKEYINEDFKEIKGYPISYWMSQQMKETFIKYDEFERIGRPRQGIATGKNEEFVRNWTEVNYKKIGFNYRNLDSFHNSNAKYVPYNKGGKQRKWYGNNDYILKFDKENYRILENQGNHLPSRQHYFQKCITWSDISGRNFAARYCDYGFVFDVKGSSGFPDEENIYFVLALLNSCITPKFIDMLNPTLTTQVGDLKRIPVINTNKKIKDKIDLLSKENVEISKNDWDDFELSWDFKNNPLLRYKNECKTLLEAFSKWKKFKETQFLKLKENEEEINRIFIDLYGLVDELIPKVQDSEISIRLPNRKDDTKHFLSYFIGTVMGRYSLEVSGIAFAGGEWDDSKYLTFKPNKYGLILLTDEYYFEDDIIARLREFLSVTFGEETVEENLQWLAESLEMKRNETAEERLRRYFLDEFFKDHCQVYQKRPIYWLVDSGKQKGLRTLIYMHRYQPDTMATIRFEHLQEIQTKYNNEIDAVNLRLTNPNLSATEKRELEKRRERFQKRLEELLEFDKKLAEYANAQIVIDLDDGVKVNYAKFEKVLAKIK